jgi:hypothetical protein
MQLILSLGERNGSQNSGKYYFFLQFSTLVGGDENWRRQLRKTL